MAVSYNKLWKLLVDKKMSKADRDEPVTLTILGKICDVLGCDYGDIMTYIPDKKEY